MFDVLTEFPLCFFSGFFVAGSIFFLTVTVYGVRKALMSI